MGILGGQKNQKSGKCHEMSTQKNLGGWGSKFQKSGKFHELPRKSINIFLLPRKSITKILPRKIIIKCNLHLIRWGGGVTGENFKVTKHQVLKSISGMRLTWTKPGNPRAGG